MQHDAVRYGGQIQLRSKFNELLPRNITWNHFGIVQS